jgi:hypothetical protein
LGSINAQEVDPATGLSTSSTGNVLNLGGGLPWSGTVTGAAGGFSGGSTAAYNPSTGNIIFGYVKSTVSQSVAINTALANAGTGIQISGYKYSWQINNDLNNSGGNRGTITGNVSLLGSSGNVLESFNYDYSKENLPNFKTYSGTQFFNSRYDTTTANSLTVSFTGKDQNFWAGYYGPRVHVDNLSLLYTVKPTPVVVDPCISDPLSSPTCPGYALATVKNSILGSTVAGASVTSYVPTTNYTQPAPAAAPPAVADAAPALAQASPQQQAQQPPPQQQGPQPQQPGQDPNQNLSIAQDNPAQTSPQQAGPPPTSPQPAGGPPQATQTAQSAPPSAGPSQAGPQQSVPSGGGSGPSKLAMSVVKTAQANDKANQQTAVQNAAKAFEATVQSSNAASNAAVSMNQDMSANSATSAAQFASQSTQASMQAAVQSNQNPQQTQQTVLQSQQSTKSVQLTQQTQEVQQTKQEQNVSIFVQLQSPQPALEQVETKSVASTKTQTTKQVETQQSQTQTVSSNVAQIQPLQEVQQVETQPIITAKIQSTQQVETQQSQQLVATLVQLQPPQPAVQQTETQTVATVKMQTPQQVETQQSQSQTVTNITEIQLPAYTPPVQQETQSTSVVMLKPPTIVETESQQQASSGTGLTVSRNPFAYNPLSSFNTSNTSLALVQTSTIYQPRIQEKIMEVEAQQMQVASFGGVGKAGNPLSEMMMQQRFELMQENIQQQTSSVNRNVQSNDLAGGVDLASMAVVPPAFNAYSFVLKDAAFYEPKEVYKNQKTVDNVQVLRQLSSDSLHKRMIDMQYK